MTPEQAIAGADRGEFLPVYLLLGEERYLRDQLVEKLRSRVLAGGIVGLNDDEFRAGEAEISAVLGAVRTPPMMGPRRWVKLGQLESWETKGKKSDSAKSGKPASTKADPLDRLAEYCQTPLGSSVLVLCADSLNGRRKLVALAKKQGFLVGCDPMSKNDLPRWVSAAARDRKCKVNSATAELIVEVAGPELSVLNDAVERLSLFVGEGNEITEESLGKLLTVVRPATVWELVDALGRRDAASALALLGRVYDAEDRGLKLLSVIGWSTRQLLRFQAAQAEGFDANAAAKAAGAPPFKARALAQQAKKIPSATLERWLVQLRDVDFMLKGGSKRPPLAILEAAVLDLCAR